MGRARTVILVVAVLGALLPGNARGHGTIEARTVLERVDPEIAGLTVQVAVSVTAQIIVENRTPEVLEVLDDTGTPFMRIGPGGVEGDFASPFWISVNSPNGVPVPPGRPAATPQWRRVSAEPSWGWFDHRMHPGSGGVVAGPWTLPMRLGTQSVIVHGRAEPFAERGAFVPILRSDARAAEGVVVAVLPGRIPGVYLVNDGPDVVTVIGRDGKPFARIGPDGVEVDRANPTWIADRKAQGRILESLGQTGWERIDDKPALAWIEDRGLYAEDEPPAHVRGATEPVDIHEWRVPIEVAGERITLEAVTQWVPFVAAAVPSDASSFPWAPVVAVAAAVALLLARWRFRTTRQPAP
jgi:hypothetical protein